MFKSYICLFRKHGYVFRLLRLTHNIVYVFCYMIRVFTTTRCTLDVTICSAKCEMSRSTFTHVDAHAYNVEHMCICVHKYLLQAESRNHSVPLVIFKRSKIDAERERGSSAYQSFATCRSYM